MEVKPTQSDKSAYGTTVQILIGLSVLAVLVAEPAPGINESHYLPKAKHFWDAEFAGTDFFLTSHDSHFLASGTLGLLTSWLSFSAVAWIGRLVSWVLMAWAWARLCRALALPAMHWPFVLAAWILAMKYGHWSGEWAVGGIEAKSIAYPLVIFGLAEALNNRMSRAWLLLGAAVAWHPLVGFWSGLSVGLHWLLQPELLKRLKQQYAALLGAVAIGCVGVIPAAWGLRGENQEGNVVASAIHVFTRLQHHLCPQSFAPARHTAGTISLMLFLGTAVAWWLLARSRTDRSQADARKQAGKLAGLQQINTLLAWAGFALAFCGVGAAIDWFGSQDYPRTSSSLLRYYWFRWADVIVPLATVVGLWKASITFSPTSERTGTRLGGAPAVVLIALTLCSMAWHTSRHWPDQPAADALIVDNPGPVKIATADRYTDWLAVCNWIEQNTPYDSLWLTPKWQQSFKWHAQRAEVICWKDVPQDNASVHQWYRRIQDCAPPRDSQGQIRGWTDAELVDLSQKYGFQWVLVDRTIQREPLLNQEIAYPTVGVDGKYVNNRSFAIFRIRP